jgi:hypothetical protein
VRATSSCTNSKHFLHIEMNCSDRDPEKLGTKLLKRLDKPEFRYILFKSALIEHTRTWQYIPSSWWANAFECLSNSSSMCLEWPATIRRTMDPEISLLPSRHSSRTARASDIQAITGATCSIRKRQGHQGAQQSIVLDTSLWRKSLPNLSFRCKCPRRYFSSEPT